MAGTFDSVLQCVGRTPLVRLTRVVPEGAAHVYGKCEQLNPGGSVKDRIALAMVEAAERSGRLRPGMTVVEPTSGNTGIGLALVCAAKGYPIVLTMPDHMSLERRALLKTYGATVVLTPGHLDMAGAVAEAERLCKEKPGHIYLRQFENPSNPAAHEATTGPEILEGLAAEGHDRLDAAVIGVGTGGTLTGVGRTLKQRYPNVRIIAIEPEESAVLSGKPAHVHKIQGIGAGFIPKALDRSLIDEIRTVMEQDAARMTARLAREEGLLVGISSGANVSVAIDVARTLGPDGVVVTFLCDAGDRYFSVVQQMQKVMEAPKAP
ncbi:MAG: cysteine synthase A [Myxococcota bacterium]